jgi:hypothetical protein
VSFCKISRKTNSIRRRLYAVRVLSAKAVFP